MTLSISISLRPAAARTSSAPAAGAGRRAAPLAPRAPSRTSRRGRSASLAVRASNEGRALAGGPTSTSVPTFGPEDTIPPITNGTGWVSMTVTSAPSLKEAAASATATAAAEKHYSAEDTGSGWTQRLALLASHMEHAYDDPERFLAAPEDEGLKAWLLGQRSLHKRGELESERTHALEDLWVDLSVAGDAEDEEEWFEHLRAHVRMCGEWQIRFNEVSDTVEAAARFADEKEDGVVSITEREPMMWLQTHSPLAQAGKLGRDRERKLEALMPYFWPTMSPSHRGDDDEDENGEDHDATQEAA